MSFFTKAVVRALQEFPDVNSLIDGPPNQVRLRGISVAVSGPKGLMVPVVRTPKDFLPRCESRN